VGNASGVWKVVQVLKELWLVCHIVALEMRALHDAYKIVLE